MFILDKDTPSVTDPTKTVEGCSNATGECAGIAAKSFACRPLLKCGLYECLFLDKDTPSLTDLTETGFSSVGNAAGESAGTAAKGFKTFYPKVFHYCMLIYFIDEDAPSVTGPTETVGVVEDCTNANGASAECPVKGNTMDDTATSCDDEAAEYAPGISESSL